MVRLKEIGGYVSQRQSTPASDFRVVDEAYEQYAKTKNALMLAMVLYNHRERPEYAKELSGLRVELYEQFRKNVKDRPGSQSATAQGQYIERMNSFATVFIWLGEHVIPASEAEKFIELAHDAIAEGLTYCDLSKAARRNPYAEVNLRLLGVQVCIMEGSKDRARVYLEQVKGLLRTIPEGGAKSHFHRVFRKFRRQSGRFGFFWRFFDR